MESLQGKEAQLESFIARYEKVIVAFSGGVDSSYLAFVAHRVLGERSHAVTALSPAVSEMQKEQALVFARTYGLNHSVIQTGELENNDYTSNPANRCYFCKTELYSYLEELRDQWQAQTIFDGSNTDDLGDYRPGRKAAEDRSVISPLIEVGLSKEEIRLLSKNWGLPTWDQPAMPCLSSRFPYGVAITEEKLRQVDRAENFLRGLGLKNFRVRHHETLARIEVDRNELARLLDPDLFDRINRELRSLGYRHVTLDLQGFRSGSLNEVLKIQS